MGPDRVCVGAVIGAHGTAGAVRIKAFTAEPLDVAAYGAVADEAGKRSFDLQVTGMSAGAVLVRIDGIDDRDAAEALKGTRLYVPRDSLPAPDEEEFYHADLLGLVAALPDGTPVGTVTAVHELGAGDAIEIARDDGLPSVLVPFTRDAVPEVDIAGRRLVVDPPDGLMDDTEGLDGPDGVE